MIETCDYRSIGDDNIPGIHKHLLKKNNIKQRLDLLSKYLLHY